MFSGRAAVSRSRPTIFLVFLVESKCIYPNHSIYCSFDPITSDRIPLVPCTTSNFPYSIYASIPSYLSPFGIGRVFLFGPLPVCRCTLPILHLHHVIEYTHSANWPFSTQFEFCLLSFLF